MDKHKIKTLRFRKYGGYWDRGYEIKYTIKDIGTIKIAETAPYPEYYPNRPLVNKTIRNIKTIRKIFKELENGIIDELTTYYKDGIMELFCDAPVYTIEIFYHGGKRVSFCQKYPNKVVQKVIDLINLIEVKDPSQYGYQIAYLVRSPHTLDQKYIKTAFYDTKEKAIEAYKEDASKYCTMGLMRLYHADLITWNLFNDKKISDERIVDNGRDFWDEYHEKLLQKTSS